MNDTTQLDVPVSRNIILARHIVGILLLLLAQSPAAYKAGGFLETWLGAAIVVFGIAGIITGLSWLFFTRHESGKSLNTFTICSWVLSLLILIGQWIS